MFCYALLCVLSSFTIILMGKRELVALLFVFLVSSDCYCSVVIYHSAVGRSAIRSKVVVLLLLIRCLLLLPFSGSVFALCFVMHCFVSSLVLQSS